VDKCCGLYESNNGEADKDNGKLDELPNQSKTMAAGTPKEKRRHDAMTTSRFEIDPRRSGLHVPILV